VFHVLFPTSLLLEARAWGFKQDPPLRSISEVLAALVRKGLQ
jgi:hypothetical protein